MDRESLDLLRKLGLNEYESRLYLALVNSGSTTASELSTIAEIPRPRAYDVLEKLAKKGFISIQPGRPTKFKANSVAESFDALKREKAREHDDAIKEISAVQEKLQKRIKDVTEDIDITTMSDYVWVLKDEDNIHSKISQLIKKANTEVILSTSSNGLKKKMDLHEASLKAAAERGVKISVYAPHRDKALIKRVGEFAKTIEHESQRMLIADDHVMLFLTPEQEKKQVGAWINSPYFAQNIKKLL